MTHMIPILFQAVKHKGYGSSGGCGWSFITMVLVPLFIAMAVIVGLLALLYWLTL